ncbi:MAG: Patatin [Bacteroidetes bacterium]|jgi:predicted acylesterase/phospholipase RssA|nr:Patatin [Bacteroidota bacterium]
MDSNEPKKTFRPKTIKRARLPKIPFNNIAISLSGGGFRAAGFHMGVLSYLSSINVYDTSVLERVRVLSTSSAGTFVGVKYTATIKKGGTMHDAYKQLYDFIGSQHLVEEALQYLSDDKNWTNGRQRTLINSFAAVYHRSFESEKFGLLWDETHPLHLKEINFNATEFNFALPFRFMKTERSDKTGNENEFIGNNKIHIPVDVAKDVRLADIVAASSCFPFGFEPINFPNDFIHPDSVQLRDHSLFPDRVYDGDKIEYPIGLMDGGIDDNQGVDAVVMSEERMKNYQGAAKEFRSDDKKAVDLFIISDASIPRMESYRSTAEKTGFLSNLNFKKLRNFGILSALTGTAAITLAALSLSKTAVVLLTVFGTTGILMAFVLLALSLGFSGFAKLLGVPEFFSKRMVLFDNLRFGLLYNLIGNRRKSAMKLVSKVFIKQMRWHSFQRVYGEAEWRPRLIMNAIFDMTDEEVEKRKKKYPQFSPAILEPGEKLIQVANKANSMGTTLWFTDHELEGKDNMLDTVIACGQFNICFNLLEYIEKFIKNPKYQNSYEKYSPEIKQSLNEFHQNLLKDWEKFKKDPYWMVNEWNAKAV